MGGEKEIGSKARIAVEALYHWSIGALKHFLKAREARRINLATE